MRGLLFEIVHARKCFAAEVIKPNRNFDYAAHCLICSLINEYVRTASRRKQEERKGLFSARKNGDVIRRVRAHVGCVLDELD